MLSEKTNKTLYRVVTAIGVILLFGGIILDLIPDSIVPQNDWYTVCMMHGISLVIIGEYFNSLKLEEDKNGGCSEFCYGLIALFLINNIKHFTTPIIAGIVFGCILLMIAFILTGKRWQRARAKKKEQSESEKNEG